MYNPLDKAYQNYAELIERIKDVNEFWINSVYSSVKEFFNISKTK